MAETIARRGGMAVIPQDIPTDVVAEVVSWVKNRNTVFETAVTLTPTETTGMALAVIPKRSHGAAIVTHEDPGGRCHRGRLRGVRTASHRSTR